LLSSAKVGEKNPRSKLSDGDVLDIYAALMEGEKEIVLALRYKVSRALISHIRNGRRWKYLKDDYQTAQ
jgi:hypothetical protein